MFSAGEKSANGIYSALSACYATPAQAEEESKRKIFEAMVQDACGEPMGSTPPQGEFDTTTYTTCEQGGTSAIQIANARKFDVACSTGRTMFFKSGSGWIEKIKPAELPPVSVTPPKQRHKGVNVGDLFTLPQGETPWRQKPALFFFSAPWCPGCHVHIPRVLEFVHNDGQIQLNGQGLSMKDLVDVYVVCVGRDLNEAQADAQNYPGTKAFLTRGDNEWIEKIFPGLLPFSVLVNGNGVVLYTAIGVGTNLYEDQVEVEPDLLQALAQLPKQIF